MVGIAVQIYFQIYSLPWLVMMLKLLRYSVFNTILHLTPTLPHTGSYYVAQAGLQLKSLLFSGWMPFTGVCLHTSSHLSYLDVPMNEPGLDGAQLCALL